MSPARSILLALVVATGLGAVPAAAAACFGEPATIVGTGDRDVLFGTSGRDVIAAKGGRDLVRGRGGRDLICGGGGRDRLLGGSGRDRLKGGGGSDTLEGGRKRDTLKGGAGPDACFHGRGRGRSRSCAPMIAAAGDISCATYTPAYNDANGTDAACQMRATSNLILGRGIDAVLPLGDLQYDAGELDQFRSSYARTWGRFYEKTRPAPGNHEFDTAGAIGYYTYFGARAGAAPQGWYSFDLGSWHLISLNTQCGAVGGCDASSPQATWLRDDLAASRAPCTLAYWHIPRFSSSGSESTGSTGAFWMALHDAGAEVVLNGHAHHYERFAPQEPSGEVDRQHGIRQIVVGTGGRSLSPFASSASNSVARNARTFGVLHMALLPDGYVWRFVPAAGGSFTDGGRGTCHEAP